MDIYSCHYPILHTIDFKTDAPVTYNILLDNEKIYTGKVFPKTETGDRINIDISEICREYLDTGYDKINSDQENLTQGALTLLPMKNTIRKFIVEVNSMTEEYNVMYNYNTGYTQIIRDDQLILNEPILDKIDPRQKIMITAFDTTSAKPRFSFRINQEHEGYLEPVKDRLCFYTFIVDLPALGIALFGDDTITLSLNEQQSITYTVAGDCTNRFALYYVNKQGGIDHLVCSGKAVESWKTKRTDMRTYSDRLDRLDFEQLSIHQEIEKSYELRTPLMQDEQSHRMDHLIFSPKVWIHELGTDKITACHITDTSLKVKTFRNDRKIQYTIKTTESQQYIRR